MNADWIETTLGDVSDFKGGSQPPKSEFIFEPKDGYVRMLQIRDFKSDAKACYIPKTKKTNFCSETDIMIGRYGASVGQIHRGKSGAYNVALIRTIPDHSKIDQDFFYYYLTSDVFQKPLAKVSQRSAQAGFSKPDISPFKFFLPPLEEQKRIVAILDEAFAGLDRARAHTEANLQNARDLFEAFLYGVFQTGEEKWEQKEWGNICNFVRGPFGGSLKKSMFVEKGYAVYEQKHAIHDHFNQLRYFIDEEKFSEMRRFEVKAGDLIMSCSGVTLGRVAIIPDGIPKGIINQALLKLTPSEILSVDFLKHWLRSKVFQDIIFEHAGGAAIPNVPSAKILKKILLPVPSLEEQNQLVADIDSMLERTKSMEGAYKTKLADLDDLRQSLLQKAFAGELT